MESDPIPGLLLLILREVLLVAPFHLDCWTLLTSAPLCSSPSFRVKIRVNPHRSHDCNVVCVCVYWSVGWKSASPPHHPLILVRRVPIFLSVTDPIVTNIRTRTHTHKTIFHEKIEKDQRRREKKEDPIRRFSDKRKRSPHAG